MLVVADDLDLHARLDEALWQTAPADFLAHGFAGGPHDARQPILLSQGCEAANGARMVALADGLWREDAAAFDRAFLFFDETGREQARSAWRALDGRDGVEREFHELVDGEWERKF
jgi:DNA polymerase-3 subunit chi